MREAHPLEQEVGISYYVSDCDGTGGRLRSRPADFVVRELEQFDAEPIEADTGAYPHVLVRVSLENWDTNDFARALSNRLGISRERVSWAGTKDKRAVTTQLFTVSGIEPDAIPDFTDVSYEVVGRTGRPILFGDLAGNEFEVVVRETDAVEHAEETARQLRAFAGSDPDDEEGPIAVPNYFGHQRFGSKRPITHEVGLTIVREDWEGAVMTYVGNPSEREPDDTREARTFVEETRDWQAALDRFPRHLTYERSMIHHLAVSDNSPEAFRSALETLPTNLQQLFVNAAQSYVFNRILSKRLERGLPFDRPVEGDVVCFTDGNAPGGLAVPETDRRQRVSGDRVDSVTRHCERGRAFVTAPLVGTETELSGGETGDIERGVFNEVGVGPGDFDLPGEFHSEGTRRAVLVRTTLGVETDPLRLSFALPRGSYATVVLREFTKRDPEKL